MVDSGLQIRLESYPRLATDVLLPLKTKFKYPIKIYLPYRMVREKKKGYPLNRYTTALNTALIIQK